MPKDLYAVLGVEKNASLEDIKKAYRQKSKEWHPDKHKGEKAAEDKFKEINEAYEVLGNVEKRQRYDQFGTTGAAGMGGGPGMGGMGGFDFSGFSQGDMGGLGDIFESFFGGGGRGGGQTRQQGQDREVEITIDLADVVAGKKLPLSLKLFRPCGTCKGDGAEPGSSVVTCKTCGGTGQVTRVMQSFFGAMQQRMVCSECKGSGKVPEKPCRMCKGEGRTQEWSELLVDIPAGISDGQTLRLRGQGDAGRRGAVAGDLFVHIRVRPDARFEREGDDIRSSMSVPLLTALLGGEIDVETVHGPVTLAIPAGTQSGQVMRIKGKGVPTLNSRRSGDHYVKIDVDIPTKLSREERRIVEEWRKAREE